MNKIIEKSKGNKPLGRTKAVSIKITELLNLYASGQSKNELKEFATNRYKIKEQQFYVYWRWMMDEYSLQIGNKEERIQDHLRDLDELYREAVSEGKMTAAKQIKKFIMELEGTYVPKDNSLFKSFDFNSIELKIVGTQANDNNQITE